MLFNLPNPVPSPCPARLDEALQDMITQIQIKPNFCIHHPNYKPLEIPAEAVGRFQRAPIALQTKYLALQLRSFLYGIYYNAALQRALAPDASSAIPYQNLENNTFLGVDLELFERLHNSNSGQGYFDTGWTVLRQEADGSLAVHKDGLTLHIDCYEHLQPAEQSAAVNDIVAIRLPRNLVQNGFYVSVGNAGLSSPAADPPAQTVRIYFNLTPDGAVALMAGLTQRLNQVQLPFHFKVLYNAADYHRYDSGVLYVEKSHYGPVREVVQALHQEHKLHFKPEIPLFTKFLATGVGLAEEPNNKFETRESFGQHRCQIIANSLLDAWQRQDDSPTSRMAAIYQNFARLGIDLAHPYLNPNSDDIYAPFHC